MTDSARRPSETAANGSRHQWQRWAANATRVVILLSAVGAIVLTAATAAPPDGASDFERYAGTWYEVARVPNQLQAPCEGDVTATYKPMRDGSIAIANRCEGARPAREVPVGRALPERIAARHADAWRVMLDADDHYSVVSDPQHRFMWILSRTPVLDAPALDNVVARLRAEGYPVDSLVPTGQAPRRVERPDRTLPRRLPLMT